MFRSDVNYYISDMCRIFLPDAPECGFFDKKTSGWSRGSVSVWLEKIEEACKRNATLKALASNWLGQMRAGAKRKQETALHLLPAYHSMLLSVRLRFVADCITGSLTSLVKRQP